MLAFKKERSISFVLIDRSILEQMIRNQFFIVFHLIEYE